MIISSFTLSPLTPKTLREIVPNRERTDMISSLLCYSVGFGEISYNPLTPLNWLGAWERGFRFTSGMI
ncbi:hypothetical protein L873DRAFT_1819880 [Choiromyces venosus 120613-1]|uniref:Uncharacterized protein n=1 Tax=Choiromyces venosus 120613-1 TaxID=1336337 RepID=A0A3N4J1T2_9PEZI|nr:hypothetical protein L873DRAFT_1819880 [Choiromyces venosus 120613-1]